MLKLKSLAVLTLSYFIQLQLHEEIVQFLLITKGTCMRGKIEQACYLSIGMPVNLNSWLKKKRILKLFQEGPVRDFPALMYDVLQRIGIEEGAGEGLIP